MSTTKKIRKPHQQQQLAAAGAATMPIKMVYPSDMTQLRHKVPEGV
jgi:hypothetical protein